MIVYISSSNDFFFFFSSNIILLITFYRNAYHIYNSTESRGLYLKTYNLTVQTTELKELICILFFFINIFATKITDTRY